MSPCFLFFSFRFAGLLNSFWRTACTGTANANYTGNYRCQDYRKNITDYKCRDQKFKPASKPHDRKRWQMLQCFRWQMTSCIEYTDKAQRKTYDHRISNSQWYCIYENILNTWRNSTSLSSQGITNSSKRHDKGYNKAQ